MLREPLRLFINPIWENFHGIVGRNSLTVYPPELKSSGRLLSSLFKQQEHPMKGR